MIRLGLCCQFVTKPIHFRAATVSYTAKLNRKDRLDYLATRCEENLDALATAIETCHELGIGAFRVRSDLFPVATHDKVGYTLDELPTAETLAEKMTACAKSAKEKHIRLTFHPDQFVVLNSPKKAVHANSCRELSHHAFLAEKLGADVINIHGGGVYGDKASALQRLETEIKSLPDDVRSRLTLENDDRSYTVEDLLPVCEATGVPLVYDVHHHRCLPDELAEREATDAAFATWDREPLAHISSPKNGWLAGDPKPHADMINRRDFPISWMQREFTLDIEAKSKEIAVLELKKYLERKFAKKNEGYRYAA